MVNNMNVYTIRVVTESLDTYVWVYTYVPTFEEVIKKLMDWEGFDYDDPDNGFDWFCDVTSVYMNETVIVEKK